MHFLTAKQVCYLTRIPYQTLNYWVKIGAITPMHDPGGKGNHRRGFRSRRPWRR